MRIQNKYINRTLIWQKLVQGYMGDDPLLQLVLESLHGFVTSNAAWHPVVLYYAPVAEAVMTETTLCMEFFTKPHSSTCSLPGPVGVVTAELFAQIFWLSSNQNLVDSLHSLVVHQLVHTEPLALFQ